MSGAREELFRGGVLVNTQLHRLPILSQDVWVWHISSGGEVLRDITDAELASLQEEGWELFDPVDAAYPFLALVSQLADTQTVLPIGTSSVKTLVKRDSISSAEHAPVILAFTLPPTEQPPPFPSSASQLARLGELGLIVDKDRFHVINLHLLGDPGLQAAQRMQEALQMVLTNSQSVISSSPGWIGAQANARLLAKLYWDAHVLAQADPHSEDSKKSEKRFSRNTVKFQSRAFPPLPDLVTRNPKWVPIFADYITQKLLRALLDADDYVQYPDQLVAVHRSEGDIRVTIQPGSGETWRHVLASLDALGDEIADTFCAVLALAIDQNGIGQLTKPFLLDPDDILRICQRKQSNRSYTPLQRAHTVRHLQALARVHITATKPNGQQQIQTGKPRRRSRKQQEENPEETFLGIDSPVLLLGTVIGEYKTVSGEALWEQREIIFGGWTQKATALLPQTASMLRQVLKYHSLRERHVKRLGRYLTLQCFNNGFVQNGSVIECRMQELLDQAGIKASDHNPARVREAIERALERLKEDKVIGSYSLVFEGDPHVTREAEKRITQYAYGWWSLYVSQTVRIDPPQSPQEILGLPEGPNE